jgi:hypothetical protein
LIDMFIVHDKKVKMTELGDQAFATRIFDAGFS